MNEQLPHSRHSYPLSALFVLMAACAVVTSLLTPVARVIVSGTIGVPEAISASVAGTVFVSVLSGVIGLYHYRRWRGLAWGILTGAALGTVIGPIALAPVEMVPSILFLSLIGAVLLVAIGAFFRLASL